jgi:hypothetical protein
MKNFFTLKYIIGSIIVILLLLIIVWLLNKNQKFQTAAIIIAQVAETRAALSSYLAENGVYPEAREFQSLNIKAIGQKVVLVYNSTGAGYGIDFNLPIGLGAFKTKGAYCATEKGIIVGPCLSK